jgi:hypothetical protein
MIPNHAVGIENPNPIEPLDYWNTCGNEPSLLVDEGYLFIVIAKVSLR